MSDDATFWFDPMCPFTWRTSRWLTDVTGARGLSVDWRLMSLAILNEGKEIPEQYRAAMAQGRRLGRLLLATGQLHGVPARAALYTELGTRVHEQHRGADDTLIAEALAAAGLPADLIASADDESLDAAVRASHDESQARTGTESGSPILAIGDGPGFFGPVVVPVPTGEAAEKLFDAVRLLSAVGEFSELKRARSAF